MHSCLTHLLQGAKSLPLFAGLVCLRRVQRAFSARWRDAMRDGASFLSRRSDHGIVVDVVDVASAAEHLEKEASRVGRETCR